MIRFADWLLALVFVILVFFGTPGWLLWIAIAAVGVGTLVRWLNL